MKMSNKFIMALLLFVTSKLFAQTDTLLGRDAIGDMNSTAVRKGDFPGSIQLPDKKTAIGFGGFIKTITYFDSHKEKKSDIITPGYFNPYENNGQFGISSSLSRFLFDARANLPQGKLRGYLEVDFANGSFNVRHAYATWKQGKNEVLAGRFWSALMDLPALSFLEGTGQPSISGVIYNRQAQVRYTRQLNNIWKFHISLEDPSSSDALIPSGFRALTSAPDVIMAIGATNPKIGHVQLAAILRKIDIDSLSLYRLSNTATGVSIASYLVVGNKGRLVSSASYGTGLGKYMLGINGVAGYITQPKTLSLAKTYGAVLNYQHKYNVKWRSNVGIGTAGLSDVTNTSVSFRNSWYGNVNLFYQVMPMFTIGMEYIYAESNYAAGAKAINHRFQIGIQIF
jgi:hypothetical protein